MRLTTASVSPSIAPLARFYSVESRTRPWLVHPPQWFEKAVFTIYRKFTRRLTFRLKSQMLAAMSQTTSTDSNHLAMIQALSSPSAISCQSFPSLRLHSLLSFCLKVVFSSMSRAFLPPWSPALPRTQLQMNGYLSPERR